MNWKFWQRKTKIEKEADEVAEHISQVLLGGINEQEVAGMDEREMHDLSEQLAIKAMQAVDPDFKPPKTIRYYSVEEVMAADFEDIRTELLNQLADGRTVAEVLVHGK